MGNALVSDLGGLMCVVLSRAGKKLALWGIS
jgi:hypothetical protein